MQAPSRTRRPTEERIVLIQSGAVLTSCRRQWQPRTPSPLPSRASTPATEPRPEPRRNASPKPKKGKVRKPGEEVQRATGEKPKAKRKKKKKRKRPPESADTTKERGLAPPLPPSGFMFMPETGWTGAGPGDIVVAHSELVFLTYNLSKVDEHLPERIGAFMDIIAVHQPHIVALQEVTLDSLPLLLAHPQLQGSYYISQDTNTLLDLGLSNRFDTCLLLIQHSVTCLGIERIQLPGKGGMAILAELQIKPSAPVAHDGESSPLSQAHDLEGRVPDPGSRCAVLTMQGDGGRGSLGVRADQFRTAVEALSPFPTAVVMGDFQVCDEVEAMGICQDSLPGFSSCWEQAGEMPPTTCLGDFNHHIFFRGCPGESPGGGRRRTRRGPRSEYSCGDSTISFLIPDQPEPPVQTLSTRLVGTQPIRLLDAPTPSGAPAPTSTGRLKRGNPNFGVCCHLAFAGR